MTQVTVGLPEVGPGSAESIVNNKVAKAAGEPTRLQQYSDGRRDAGTANTPKPTVLQTHTRQFNQTTAQVRAEVDAKAAATVGQPVTKAQSDKAAWEQKIKDIQAAGKPSETNGNEPAPDGDGAGDGDGEPAEGMRSVEVDGMVIEVNQGDLTDEELQATLDDMTLSDEDQADWQANIDTITENIGAEAFDKGVDAVLDAMTGLNDLDDFTGDKLKQAADHFGMDEANFGALLAAAKMHQGRSVASYSIAAGHNPAEVAAVLDANPHVRDAAFVKLAKGDGGAQLRAVIGSIKSR